MREIEIKNRKNEKFISLVDDEDYERVASIKWYISKKPSGVLYARTSRGKKKGFTCSKQMHSFILGNTQGTIIDHINGNGLDNRRSNLRVVSVRENALNTSRNRHLDTRGVNKFRDRFQSKISINGLQIHLGTFLSQNEAVAAYQAAQRVEKALKLNCTNHNAHAINTGNGD